MRTYSHLPAFFLSRAATRFAPWLVLLLAVTAPGPASLGQVAGSIEVYPGNSSIEIGSSRQFSAYVPISPNGIAWSVNDIPGGNAELGTISTTGLYQAPALPPTSNVLTIRARSTAYPSSVGAATLTVTRKYPWLWSVSPSQIAVGPFQVSFNGANFAPDSVAQMNGADLATTYISPTRLVATGTASTAGTVRFTVRHPGPGAVTGNAVSARVNAVTVSVAITPTSATIDLGATRTFTATVTGTANTAVTWSVNGILGGSPVLGTISPAGLYAAPAILPAHPTVTVRAASAVVPTAFAEALVTFAAPPPPPVSASRLAAARFLEQASFGPTPATLAAVQQAGIAAYLESQFTLPATPIPTPSGNSIGDLRRWMLYNTTSAQDQLRQRVAYALGQIVVTSASKLVYADEMLPWLRLLSQHAFGNYREFLEDISKSPSMGKYLDHANSLQPGLGGGANENYGRELLQLFTIGLWQLNQDGSYTTNAAGERLPTYSQQTVQQVALALTGWTYATAPGATPNAVNWEYFGAPLEPRPLNHETSAKTFLGCNLPAGQTVEQDLDGLLDCLIAHPNTAPFVCTRLIRSLVMSNPSGDYIRRVADVFVDNGQGVRGDLKAVVRAILLDPEARNDTALPHQGRLKEPILHAAGLLRALNGGYSSSHQITYLFDYMAQAVLAPPSVFNWFSPLYRVPKSPLYGPEFQIYTPTEASLRGNLFHSFLTYPGGDITLDLSPFQPYGNDMSGLVDQVNTVLLHGRMPPAMKQVLINAATPGYDAKTRIETVLYLTALSGQFAVQY